MHILIHVFNIKNKVLIQNQYELGGSTLNIFGLSAAVAKGVAVCNIGTVFSTPLSDIYITTRLKIYIYDINFY